MLIGTTSVIILQRLSNAQVQVWSHQLKSSETHAQRLTAVFPKARCFSLGHFRITSGPFFSKLGLVLNHLCESELNLHVNENTRL